MGNHGQMNKFIFLVLKSLTLTSGKLRHQLRDLPKATQPESRPSNLGRISALDSARTIPVSRALSTCRMHAHPDPDLSSGPVQGSRPTSLEQSACWCPQLLLAKPRARAGEPGRVTCAAPRRALPRGLRPQEQERQGHRQPRPPLRALPSAASRALPPPGPACRAANASPLVAMETRTELAANGSGAGWGDGRTRRRSGKEWGSLAAETSPTRARPRSLAVLRLVTEITFGILSFLWHPLPSLASGTREESEKYLLNE